MAEPNEILANELQQQLFVPVEMANQASVGGMVLLTCLMLLGLLGMAWTNTGGRNKAQSVHSDNSHSFHGRHTMRSASPSLSSAVSMGNSSHITSVSQHHLGSGPKSLPLSIVSVMSRGTMTSANKCTMTDGIKFDIKDDLKRLNLHEKYSHSRVGSIVNTADITVIEERERQIERKDSSNTESYERDDVGNPVLAKKLSVDNETNTPWNGVENAAFDSEEGVVEASRRCSDYVNTNCSGRRRKFEPKYATISNMHL